MNDNERSRSILQGQQSKEKLNEGSAWMSIASVVSRILGVLYIIPWMHWIGDPQVGTEANALYGIGYNYYSIFLAIAIAGVPAAISKQMTNYMAKGQYQTSQRLFKSGTVMMLATGIVSALALYFLAPFLAQGKPARNVEDVILVIRSLVPALALIPLLSILRGYFQAYLEMKPSAISQVTEQFARVIYMLATVYLIRVVMDGSVAKAVSHSTFAAFIGAVMAIMTLAFYYFKNRDKYALPAGHVDSDYVATRTLLFEIVRIAIPFVITGSIIEMVNLIDMNTFMPIMQRVSDLGEGQLIYEYGVFNANARRVIQIIISFATAISSTTVPVVTDAYTRELAKFQARSVYDDHLKPVFDHTCDVVLHSIHLFTLVMVPAAIGLAVLAAPVYQLLYGINDPLGEFYLQISCLMAIPMGLFYVLVMTLQSMDQQKKAIFGIVLGLGIKLLVQFPLLAVCGSEGAMYASILAFIFMCAFYLACIYKRIQFSFSDLAGRIWPALKVILIMGLMSEITYQILHWIIPEPNKLGAFVMVILVALVGIWVYLIGLIKSRQLEIILGQDKSQKLRQFLHL